MQVFVVDGEVRLRDGEHRSGTTAFQLLLLNRERQVEVSIRAARVQLCVEHKESQVA